VGVVVDAGHRLGVQVGHGFELLQRVRRGGGRVADLLAPVAGVGAPVLLRFPQLVAAQVRKLQRAFSRSIREFEYQGGHMCVYPMKVNQQRSVVEEYLREGSRYDFGLEAGSKAELYAALALEQTADSLLVLNGFKDEEFIELAFAGARCGKRVVIVIEKLNELDHVINVAERHGSGTPILGMRVKLYSKGSGRWEKSGGEAAKFGLTTTEMLEVIRRLEEADRIDMLKLLHFHIGSQLTDIKRIKNAMKEAARVYAIVDNLNVHRAVDVLLFCLAHPRWEFVFQPKYAAYLNLIEPRPNQCRSSPAQRQEYWAYYGSTFGSPSRWPYAPGGAALQPARRAALGDRVARWQPTIYPRLLVYVAHVVPGECAWGGDRDDRRALVRPPLLTAHPERVA